MGFLFYVLADPISLRGLFNYIMIVKIICKNCGKEFSSRLSHNSKFCSRLCYWKFLKGKSFWNKGSFKKGQNTGKNNLNWKGDNASYSAIHYWLYSHKGKPQICEHCGITSKETKLEWASKNHLCVRDVDNYMALCISCHRNYDMTKEWKQNISKGKKGHIPWNKGLRIAKNKLSQNSTHEYICQML